MTKAEAQTLARMMGRANSFEAKYNNADAPLAVNPAATALAAASGNPNFAAQFDVNILIKYFTVVTATGVATAQTPAQVAAADPSLATQLAFFLFGNSDFAAGFTRSQQAYPLSGGWIYDIPYIYGKNDVRTNGIFPSATIKAQFRKGDLIIPAYFVSGANTIMAFVIVRCRQVGYGTLLDALNSDRFSMNMIRYVMSDITSVGLAQYNNDIGVYRQSLFGKFDSDSVSPISFKMPEQQQDGIIDVPLEKGIDKQVLLGSYINYNVVDILWSVFVAQVEKLQIGSN